MHSQVILPINLLSDIHLFILSSFISIIFMTPSYHDIASDDKMVIKIPTHLPTSLESILLKKISRKLRIMGD